MPVLKDHPLCLSQALCVGILSSPPRPGRDWKWGFLGPLQQVVGPQADHTVFGPQGSWLGMTTA